jgi:hypothetical protein
MHAGGLARRQVQAAKLLIPARGKPGSVSCRAPTSPLALLGSQAELIEHGTRRRSECERFGATKQRNASNRTIVLRSLTAYTHATNRAALVCNWPGSVELSSLMRDRLGACTHPIRP